MTIEELYSVIFCRLDLGINDLEVQIHYDKACFDGLPLSIHINQDLSTRDRELLESYLSGYFKRHFKIKKYER